MKERVQKIIANAGVCSRRAAEKLIEEGKVLINGKPAHLGQSAEFGVDSIVVDGKELKVAPQKKYFILNKPRGVETTLKSVGGNPTVVSLIKTNVRVVPTGRLDLNSRGLVFLTNDGELALRVAHPRYRIDKVYEVLVQGKVPSEIITLLSRGVRIDGGITAPCKIEYLKQGKATLLRIILHEGKKHQVRLMFKKVGFPVLDLVRVAIGPLGIEGLEEGNSRELTKEELEALKKTLRMN